MKIVFKSLLVISLFLLGFTTAQAQMGGGGGRDMDPVKRAEQQTATMTEVLGLSEAQAAKVKEINIKYGKKAQDMRNANADGDWTAMREKMMAMTEEQNKEFKGVMTTEQYDKWVKYQADQRSQGTRRRDG